MFVLRWQVGQWSDLGGVIVRAPRSIRRDTPELVLQMLVLVVAVMDASTAAESMLADFLRQALHTRTFARSWSPFTYLNTVRTENTTSPQTWQ